MANSKQLDKKQVLHAYPDLKKQLRKAKEKGDEKGIIKYAGWLELAANYGKKLRDAIKAKDYRAIEKMLKNCLSGRGLSKKSLIKAVDVASNRKDLKAVKLLVPAVKEFYGDKTFRKVAYKGVFNAIDKGHQEAFSYFVAQGAALDAKVYTHTYLHIAASKGRLEMAKVICDKTENKQINIKSFEGFTPLDMALANGHAEMAGFLRSKGGLEAANIKDSAAA